MWLIIHFQLISKNQQKEAAGSFMSSSTVNSNCNHAVEHSGHSVELSVCLGQKVWTFPPWGGRRFVQGIRQIWLCHRGSCCRDGLFLALCPPKWKLLPDVHGENCYGKPSGLDFTSSAKIYMFVIWRTVMKWMHSRVCFYAFVLFVLRLITLTFKVKVTKK